MENFQRLRMRMGAKHLNLEFEEEDENQSSVEEEAKRKREEEERKAKKLAQEIEFVSTDPNITVSRKDLKQPAPARPQQQATQTRPAVASVTPIKEAGPSVSAPVSSPRQSTKLDSARSYSSVEVEALIRAAVAESRLDYVTDMASEVKLLEHKANKILTVIYTKVPALKNEVMQVQKLISDHNQSVIPKKKD